MMNQKATFKKLFAAVAILLAVLPLIVTFSAVLTGVFNKIGAYVWLQDQIVPFEARLVAVLLRGVNITGVVTPGASFSMLLDRPGQLPLAVVISWNCLGWQSLVLLGLTFATGLRGGWKRLSIAETVVLGVVGMFLINVFRMAFITSLAYYWNSVAAMIIHDYFAAFIALIWLIFFWWFSYSFILEPKVESTSSVK
ncbi:MAG: exosortase/archaeosortase family protein [Patescibacteria group bacterium]